MARSVVAWGCRQERDIRTRRGREAAPPERSGRWFRADAGFVPFWAAQVKIADFGVSGEMSCTLSKKVGQHRLATNMYMHMYMHISMHMLHAHVRVHVHVHVHVTEAITTCDWGCRHMWWGCYHM